MCDLSATDRILAIETKFLPLTPVENADGSLRWTRAPGNGTEQVYHFIFHLRMTMFALADNPK